jgi:hypothetical protein
MIRAKVYVVAAVLTCVAAGVLLAPEYYVWIILPTRWFPAPLNWKLRPPDTRLDADAAAYVAGGAWRKHVVATGKWEGIRAAPHLGVTGASGTAALYTWPYAVRELLAARGVHTELTNAAHGATRSADTAPCLRALLGDGIDVLFWEFAITDRWDNATAGLARYVRHAACGSARALVAVYLWTVRVRDWSQFEPRLPPELDRTFPQVVAALRGFDGPTLAVNFAGIFRDMGWGKARLLRDPTHPTAAAYAVMGHVLAEGLGERLRDPRGPRHPRRNCAPTWCLNLATPTFGQPNGIVLEHGARIADVGEHGPGRIDTRFVAKLPRCETAERARVAFLHPAALVGLSLVCETSVVLPWEYPIRVPCSDAGVVFVGARALGPPYVFESWTLMRVEAAAAFEAKICARGPSEMVHLLRVAAFADAGGWEAS